MNKQLFQFGALVDNVMEKVYLSKPESLREQEKIFRKMTKKDRNSRIMYPFALDMSSNEVTYILDANQKKKYVCLDCKKPLIPRALVSSKRYAHFYHKNTENRICEESFEHHFVKNELSSKLKENIGNEVVLWLWYLVDDHQKQVNLMEEVVKVELEHSVRDENGVIKARADIALLDKDEVILWAVEVVDSHRVENETLEFYKSLEINCIEVYVNSINNYNVIHFVGEPVPHYDGSVSERLELYNQAHSIDYKARLVIRNKLSHPPEYEKLQTLTAVFEIKEGSYYKDSNKIRFYFTGEDLLEIFEFLRDNQELINFLIAQKRKEERGKYDNREQFKELESRWRQNQEQRRQSSLDEDFFNT